MVVTTITRRIEFDSGHRIPDHKSKCRSVHGHRYVLEATVLGPVKAVEGASDNGMIMDFGDLKKVMLQEVGDLWDHAFLCYVHDGSMREAINQFLGGTKVIWVPFVPTVENLVEHAFYLLEEPLADKELDLVHVRLYETPNCYADTYAEGYARSA